MKNLLSVLALSLLLVCGCGDSTDDLADDTKDVMEDMNKVLASVQDENSAKAAKPKLEDLSKKMQEIQKRADAMKLSDADEEAMRKKYEKEMEKPMSEFMGHMMRIAMRPELMQHLEDSFKNMEPPSGAGGMN